MSCSILENKSFHPAMPANTTKWLLFKNKKKKNVTK